MAPSPDIRPDKALAIGTYGEAVAAYRYLVLAEKAPIEKDRDEFAAMAAEIHGRHRADIGDDDWQRIMRMGRVIAPDQPPFSGPQAIESAKRVS